MKKFLVLIPMIVVLTGCDDTGYVEEEESNSAGFKEIYHGQFSCFSDIYVYEPTDVMYVVDDCYNRGGISVMLESDGKPMLWSNWKSYYESLGDK